MKSPIADCSIKEEAPVEFPVSPSSVLIPPTDATSAPSPEFVTELITETEIAPALDSTIIDSTIIDSAMIDSAMIDSAMIDSTIIDSTIIDSTIIDSAMIDSTISTSIDNATSTSTKPCWQEELSICLSTFFTIFLAELGDKTQVTTLLMSAQSHAPWIVFAGAGTALISTSLLGVLLGRWLSKRVPPRTLEVSSGLLLLAIGLLLAIDVIRG